LPVTEKDDRQNQESVLKIKLKTGNLKSEQVRRDDDCGL
jgi:hypothetical protein